MAVDLNCRTRGLLVLDPVYFSATEGWLVALEILNEIVDKVKNSDYITPALAAIESVRSAHGIDARADIVINTYASDLCRNWALEIAEPLSLLRSPNLARFNVCLTIDSRRSWMDTVGIIFDHKRLGKKSWCFPFLFALSVPSQLKSPNTRLKSQKDVLH